MSWSGQERLPIEEARAEIVAACRRGNRLAICAPTGSGKSTQVPQMLLDAGLAGDSGQIIILQPRRIAARMLAARVASERGVPLGTEVGYRIRMESRASRDTRILYETEGILLRRMVDNPRLDGIAAIVFDEFHERHVYGDVTLAEARRLQERADGRPDLRLVVMSATLDTTLVQDFLPGCALVEAAGRTFPVDIRYRGDLQREKPWDAATLAIAQALREGIGADGTTLVFMPGAYEIGRTIEALRQSPAGRGAEVLPLHGELPPDAQDRAVGHSGSHRRIVVATNVAETSLTIPDVRLVVDSGLARIARFDPYRGIDTLHIEPIAQASADQRAGRAGRTAPGTCLRLWALPDHRARPLHETPEIRRVDPAELLLSLAALGVRDFRAYPWLEPPAEKALARAESLLRDLGALDAANAVTPLGHRMMAFPVHPRDSRMLLAAAEEERRSTPGSAGAVREVALLCALAQGRPVLLRRVDDRTTRYRADVLGRAGGSDLLYALRACRRAAAARFDLDTCQRLGIHAAAARAATLLARRFHAIAAAQGLLPRVEARPDETVPAADFPDSRPAAEVSPEVLARCLLAAYSDQLARRMDPASRRCELTGGRKAELDRDSLAGKARLLVATEIAEISPGLGDAVPRITQATEVQEQWIADLFPGELSTAISARWDDTAGRAVGERRTLFRGLALSVRPCEVPRDAGEALLADAVARLDALPFKHWNRAVDAWMARANLVARAWPEAAIPPYDDEARELLVGQLCAGHVALRELKDVPVLPTVRDYLSAAQQALVEKAAPERVTLSNGRSLKVNYVDAPEPFVAARIQELYDVQTLPRLVAGRVPLVLHVLAPSQRPVQITADLPAFWRDHYPRIKSELARRYPKHEWR
ncbi:MAG: ATP-dependent RNA helicase [Kiritimatiellae bacterium]|nr:ATP-dependent RNA helicase [Kiritimatiellia bacterium]